MIQKDLKKYLNQISGQYTELRLQRNTSKKVGFIDGKLIANTSSSAQGVCARIYQKGSYGFASAPSMDDEAVRQVLQSAKENADFLDQRQSAKKPDFSVCPSTEESLRCTTSNEDVNQKHIIEFCAELDDYIQKKYPKLLSRTVFSPCLDMEKMLVTSEGTFSHQLTPHASLYFMMTAADKDGNPIELTQSLGTFGNFTEVFTEQESLKQHADELYEQLMRKCEGVYAQPGIKECILHPDLAGMLAHEAVGHTTEADFVQAGSVAGPYLGKQVASELVTMVDFAHTAFGKQCPIPVYTDDEGIQAKDVTIIENGILKHYMHNRESAAFFNTEPTGNARAFAFSDEPLIRMRNTVILPGTSKLEQMIESIDDGYFFTKTGNGQADSTGEFMFGIDMGYEIKNGKLGRPIRSTTISGVAFEMLKTVTMLSDDISWVSTGMCGKKQAIPVGMAGPAIKCKVNVGGR